MTGRARWTASNITHFALPTFLYQKIDPDSPSKALFIYRPQFETTLKNSLDHFLFSRSKFLSEVLKSVV